MRVGPPPVAHPYTHAALAAVRECGFPTSSDLNGAEQEGATWLELNIVDGVRQSAADAYLRPILGRPNLTVTTDALVTRLMLRNGRCSAVEYQAAAERVTAQAGESVVLTAGAVGSPTLLMLSGVGDPTDLEKLDITTEVALPGVGKNLQDHPQTGIVYSSARAMPDGVNNHGELVAALRSDPGIPAPDVQLLFTDIPYHLPTLVGPASGFTIAFSYLHPHSRGSVKLSSADPAIAPAVDPAFLSDERDLDRMLTALQLARRVGAADALAEWRGNEILPGPETLHVEQQKDFLRRSTGSYFHAAGTCAMGTDAAAVVDSELRVRGLDGLRVADASVMPTLVGANTNATVLAIAERAADLITR
jgi:choline dehydrogenase